MKHAFHDLPYRAGVGAMLINSQGLVFVAKRLDMTSEAWQMPQGGIDEGETFEQALKRELMEEIGTDKTEILAQSKDWFYYDLPEDLIPKIWGGRYRGQRQHWFALRFTGEDKDINIATDHPEFTEWKWIKAASLPDIIVPFKRTLYAKLHEEFKRFVAA